MYIAIMSIFVLNYPCMLANYPFHTLTLSMPTVRVQCLVQMRNWFNRQTDLTEEATRDRKWFFLPNDVFINSLKRKLKLSPAINIINSAPMLHVMLSIIKKYCSIVRRSNCIPLQMIDELPFVGGNGRSNAETGTSCAIILALYRRIQWRHSFHRTWLPSTTELVPITWSILPKRVYPM